jgi:hypothetical protein
LLLDLLTPYLQLSSTLSIQISELADFQANKAVEQGKIVLVFTIITLLFVSRIIPEILTLVSDTVADESNPAIYVILHVLRCIGHRVIPKAPRMGILGDMYVSMKKPTA